MKTACPNKNSKEWLDMLTWSNGNEDEAFAVFAEMNLNNPTGDIYPSSESEYIKFRDALSTTDVLDKYADAEKLARTMVQRTRLMALATGGKYTEKQIEVLRVLIQMSDEYIEHLKDIMSANPTVAFATSVSRFIGSTEFKNAQTDKSFANFGTFVHHVVEKVTDVMTASTNITKMPDDILTRDFFDKLYTDWQNSEFVFDIKGMTPDIIFQHVKDLANVLKNDIMQKNLIIPELTLFGKTNSPGVTVSGRTDVLSISPSGIVRVYDYKTKKVNTLSNKYVRTAEIDNVFSELAIKTYPVNSTRGTSQEFRGTTRSVLDTFAIQLAAYENILMQRGLKVDEGMLITLFYQLTDEAIPQLYQSAISIVDPNSMHDRASTKTKGLSSKEKRLRVLGAHRTRLNKVIPISEEAENEVIKNKIKPYPFDTTEEEYNKIKTMLIDRIDSNLSDLYGKKKEQERLRKEGKGDPVLEKLYNERIATLNSFKRLVEVGDASVTISIKMGHVMRFLEKDFTEMEQVAKDIKERYSKLNPTDAVESRKLQEQIYVLGEQMEGLDDIYKQIKELGAEIISKNDKDSPSFSEFRRQLDILENQRATILSVIQNVSFDSIVTIFKTAEEETYFGKGTSREEIRKQLELALGPIVEKLGKDAQKILDSGKLPQALVDDLKKISNIAFANHSTIDNLISKHLPDSVKNKSEIKLLSKYVTILKEIAAADMQIKYLDEFTPDRLRELIDAVTNPNSGMYFGKTDLWSNPTSSVGRVIRSIAGSFNLHDMIASASSSNPIISLFTNYLKTAEVESQQAVMNDENFINLNRARNDYKKDKTVKQENELVSEVVTVTSYDRASETIKTKEQLSIVTPFSDTYTQKLQLIKAEIKQFKHILSKLRVAAADIIDNGVITNPAEYQRLNNEIASYENKIRDKNVEYTNYIYDYGSSKFSEKYHRYMKLLPADIQEELHALYDEREKILIKYNIHSEEEIENENQMEYERLNVIETEIKKIRQRAARENNDYKERMDLIDDLFDFTNVNWNYFNSIKSRKQIQYSNDPEMFAKWERENTVVEYDEQWTIDLDAIYVQLASILGSNKELADLMDERRELLKPYRTKGVMVDPRFMTPEDAERLTVIQKEIETIQDKPKKILSPDKQKQVRALIEQLNLMKQKKENPLYKEQLNEKTDSLLKKRSIMDNAEETYRRVKDINAPAKIINEAERKLLEARQAFSNENHNYTIWYNQNHNTKFKGLIKGDPRLNADPKEFNKITVPGDLYAEHYERIVPHPKYTSKRLKEEAYNPNYHEMAGGVPMPKTLIHVNGTYELNHAYLNTLNPAERDAVIKETINPKFLELLGNPENKKFYDAFTKAFLEMQKNTQGFKLGYLSPGLMISSAEAYERGTIEGVKTNFKSFLDRNLYTNSEEDKLTGIYGDSDQKIRFRNSSQYSMELQSRDVIKAVMIWMTEAHYNMAMNNVAPVANNFVEFIRELNNDLSRSIKSASDKDKSELKNRQTELTNIINTLESERQKFIQGITDVKEWMAFRKISSTLMRQTAMLRMGFDTAMQTKNFVSGSVQNFLSASSSLNWDQSDLLWGYKEFYSKFLPNWIKSFGKFEDVPDNIKIFRFIDPAQKGVSEHIRSGTLGRAAVDMGYSELAYLQQDTGDTAIAIQVYLAVMKHAKFPKYLTNADGSLKLDSNGDKMYEYDTNGEIILVSAYDALTVNSKGQVVPKGNVDISVKQINSLRKTIISEVRRVQGNYAASDKTPLEKTVLGSLMYYYKKYLLPLVLNRFGGLRPDWEAKDVQYGYMRILYTILKVYGAGSLTKNLLFAGFSKNEIGTQTMNSFYYRRIKNASRELWLSIIIGTAVYFSKMLLSMWGDDDEEAGFFVGNMFRILWGVKSEMLSLNPIPIVGGTDEYIRNFTTITSLNREVITISKTIGDLLSLLTVGMINMFRDQNLDEDDEGLMGDLYKAAYYQNRSGRYEPGDPKLLKDFHDLTPFGNILDVFDPDSKLEMMKKQPGN